MKKVFLVVILLFSIVNIYSLELSDSDATSLIKDRILKEPRLIYSDMEFDVYKVKNVNLKIVKILKVVKTIRKGKNYFSGKVRIVGDSIVKFEKHVKENTDDFDKIATFILFINGSDEWETHIFKVKDNNLKLEEMCAVIDKNRKTGIRIKAKEDIEIRDYSSKKIIGLIRKFAIVKVYGCKDEEKNGYWLYIRGNNQIPLSSHIEFFSNSPSQLTSSENKLFADIKDKVNSISDYLEKNKNYTSISAGQKNTLRTFGDIAYKKYCKGCHQKNGEGTIGAHPSLNDNSWLWGGNIESIKKSIRNGRNGIMPAYSASLSKKEITDVSNYVLSLSSNNTNLEATIRGKIIFNTKACSGCHMVTATGLEALGSANLTDSIWTQADVPREKTTEGKVKAIAEVISIGINREMPAYDNNFLSDKELLVLSYYIKYFLSRE